MKIYISFLLFVLSANLSLHAQNENPVKISGLITPRDNEGMYLRNLDGQFEIEWTDKTEFALEVNTRQFAGLKNGILPYKVHSSKEVIEFNLPAGPITGIKKVKSGKHLQTALAEAKNEKWISEFGLTLRFNEQPEVEQLASEKDPRFVGVWDASTKPRQLTINGASYEISLKKGGQTNALLFGFLSKDNCKPFVNRCTVIGRKKGDIIIADEIHIYPIGDQAANDDPKLPRYLFIGDSISGNYDKGLREALDRNFNLHHPPTNCGPSANGKNNIVEWMGAYDSPGRNWDVISFNFGHWDAGNDKASYQANLEFVIGELKKTKAKLIWVTTCPVPKGFPPSGDLTADGKAPKRTSGVMEKYLNPWAAEVMAKHPAISICDQWQFVKDHEKDIYKDWWQTKDVHFSREMADALGKLLGEHVAKVMDVKLEEKPASAKSASMPAKTSDFVKREIIPMYQPGFVYKTKKAYGLYEDSDASAALPDSWKGIERLTAGFPAKVSSSLKPINLISDGVGGEINIENPASKSQLASIKENYAQGTGLAWYFLPKEDRYRSGPGLTGDEILADIKSDRFVRDSKHVAFIYGFYTQNVTDYYKLYRISGDSYYIDQIVKYAEGVEWLLKNRPQQLIPAERREEKITDPVSVIPHEPAALANFWPHVNAARLLLETARDDKAKASDSRVVKARQLLNTAKTYMASQITADYHPTYDRAKNGRPAPTFVEGKNTRLLRDKYSLPPRAAQVIEYTPWNQTFFYFATLTAAAKAIENLQAIDGGQTHQKTIDLYRNVVRAGMFTLQKENICVLREGLPYFFHMHTPLRDKESNTRMGFPMFSGEDNAHSGGGAVNLPYIWEAGKKFGVSEALLAGYCNAMRVTLDDASMTHKNGKAWPRNHLDSPWYLAASGRKNFPASRLGNTYYDSMTFSPQIVAANRPYSDRDAIWADANDLRRLFAGHLYRIWKNR